MLRTLQRITQRAPASRRFTGESRREMDESWRMRMGMNAAKPNIPRRRSTEEPSRRNVYEDSETLDPEDFNDVFGGPPRTVLSRQFCGSGESARSSASSSNLFYEEVFRLPEAFGQPRSGRNLPEFRIPGSGRGGRRNEEFYGDIFGIGRDVDRIGDLRRSRSRSKSKTHSKSKSNSSSVLSSEELSPFRPAIADDDISISSFASKLRPINVPSKWSRSTTMHEVRPMQQWAPDFSCSRPSFAKNQDLVEDEFMENLRSSLLGGSSNSRRVSSPETISLGPNSYGTSAVKVSLDDLDLELNSPSSSVVSSVPCQNHELAKANCKVQDEELFREEKDDDDEVMSSYIIEINSDHREESTRGEALDLDEAIAWAKEKFRSQSASEVEERSNAHQFPNGQMDGCESAESPGEDKEKKMRETEGKQQSENNIEIDPFDENIRLWSAGKEGNIKLLLSTLHHILWPNCGWYPISLASLNENSLVKKAYQRAQLCLHPDKLQQRGATLQQKYIAEKAFSILQDAWALFTSQDVFFT